MKTKNAKGTLKSIKRDFSKNQSLGDKEQNMGELLRKTLNFTQEGVKQKLHIISNYYIYIIILYIDEKTQKSCKRC